MGRNFKRRICTDLLFTPAGERKTEFTGPKGEKLHFSSVRCMEEESPGVLLIGMRSAGLYRFNTRTGEMTVFRTSRPEQKNANSK